MNRLDPSNRAPDRREPVARLHRARPSASRIGLLVLLIVALGHSGAAAQPTPGAPAVLAAWVQLATSGPVVRAVTTAPDCPRVATVDRPGGAPRRWRKPMALRAAPDPPSFPDRVCEWAPPPKARYVVVEGHRPTLRVPGPDPHRIVTFGDTGCLGGNSQDCTRDWPFAKLSRYAAARQPDLVIHLGDYNYRGTNCIAYDGCCTYNPVNCGFPDCGDSWETWQADFFTPAAPLLAAAPWVMTRGNHELCARAGRGYFRYLDPHSPPPTCAPNPVVAPTYTDPYPLYIGDSLRLVVFDSASACGELAERDDVAIFREEFARLAEVVAGGSAAQTWLISHRPMWGVLRNVPGHSTGLNYTLQQASGNRLPSAISLVLSGHEHLLQSVVMEEPGFPIQMLVGTGGDILDDPAWVAPRVDHMPMGPGAPTIRVATTIHDHGYLLMEQSAGAWTATFFDRDDHPLATCASSAQPVCSPTAP